MGTMTQFELTAEEEDRAAPAPWTYRRVQRADGLSFLDWIEDNNGSTVIENVGHIDGPRIVRAVNAMALKDGILT